jgi:membrane protein
MMQTINDSIESLVWGDVLKKYGVPGQIVTVILRNAYAVLRDIITGQLTLRAMSLVYTTLLSVVPLIAVSFSVLKAFDVQKDLEERLYGVLEPLGDKGVEITDQVMSIVNNVNGSVLGGIGLAFFVYTAISMVQKIEESFNYVWYVTKPRSLATRIVEYSAVLLIGSLTIAIALRTLAAFLAQDIVVSMQGNSVIGPMVAITNALTPYLIVISIFTFLYKFMPNTNVKFGSALVGGIAGGILWATTSGIFAAFLANSGSRQAIYASFAIAITTLIWLYLNWLILLIGAQVAFYFQNPAYLRIGRREPRLSNEMRERVALNIMYLVGKEFRDPKHGVDLRSLSRTLRIPSITLAPITLGLETKGLMTTGENEKLLPAREVSRIKLSEILDVVRVDGETGSHHNPRWDAPVQQIGKSLDAAIADAISNTTLSDFLDRAED